jgi:hypothetical protein
MVVEIVFVAVSLVVVAVAVLRINFVAPKQHARRGEENTGGQRQRWQ